MKQTYIFFSDVNLYVKVTKLHMQYINLILMELKHEKKD